MDLSLKKNGGNANGRVRLPSKKNINLALAGEKPINLLAAIIGVVLIVIAAALISKFAVVDRYMAVSEAQRQVNELQKQIDEGYEKIAGYGELTELYAHYTYSGMTSEELERCDRNKITDLLRRTVIPDFYLSQWTVTGNQLVITVTGSTLQEINLLAEKINEEPIVDYCEVITAKTTDERFLNSGLVDGNVTVYLKNASEVKEG